MSVSSRRSIVLSRSSNASGMVLMSQDRHSTHAKGESIFYIHPSEYRSNSFENNKPPRQTPSNLGLQHEHETGSMAVITPSPIEERKPFPRLPKLKGILEKSGTMAVMPPCSPVDEFKPLPSISADVRKVKSSTLQPWDTLFKGKEKQKPSDLNLTASMDSARNPRNPGGTLRSSMSTITMVPSSVPYHSKSQSFQFNTPLDSGKIFERKNAIKRQSSAFIAPPLLGSQNVMFKKLQDYNYVITMTHRSRFQLKVENGVSYLSAQVHCKYTLRLLTGTKFSTFVFSVHWFRVSARSYYISFCTVKY